jgi:hypothetical protein
MSRWNHNLLPVYVQHILIDAAKAERHDLLDKAIYRAKELVPHRFYTDGDKRLENRMFYDQPAERVPMAGFVIAKKGTV